MIIAFAGAKGSGKNFVGEYVAGVLRGMHRAFADPVREAVKETYELRSDEEYDIFKRVNHTIMGREIPGRQLVLGIGMNMRAVNPNFPLEYMEQQLRRSKESESPLVITDARFLNEAMWTRENAGIIVKIIDPTKALVQSDTSKDEHRHVLASERGIPDELCDVILTNDGVPTFRHKVLDHVIEAINKKRETK